MGKNVHFMMFDEGSTKIKCHRFQFGGNLLDTDANALGNPAAVDETFCEYLELGEDVRTKLPVHASRLEMVQNVLNRMESVLEPETQNLFDHFLSMLLSNLEDTNSNSLPIIDNVTGMKDMFVIIEVCAAYLIAQAEAKGQPTGHIDSSRRTLTIRSDLAVSMIPVASVHPQKTDSLEEAEKLSP